MYLWHFVKKKIIEPIMTFQKIITEAHQVFIPSNIPKQEHKLMN